jgi:predicted TPR repeat methyltransferase
MGQNLTDLQPGKSSETGPCKHTLSTQEHLFQKALHCHQLGDAEQALDLYLKVIDLDPDHAEACFYTALLLSDSGSHDKALPLFEKAHELQPDLPSITYQLGICQYVLGNLHPAIESFEKVMDADGEHWQAAYNLGAACYASGQISRAIEAYSLAACLHPRDVDIFFNLGLAYKKSGAFDEAVKAYESAMEINPDDPEVHYNLGRLYKDMDSKKNAIRSFETAIALRPDFGAALTNIGVLYTCEGMRDKAIGVYEKLVEIGHNQIAASHILHALKGHTTDSAPIAYIKELYDDFAGHFEERLVKDLCYETPKKAADFLDALNGGKRSYSRMLDLGCGTGLCGQAFKGMVDSITGVDLSAGMLEKAREKGIYDALVEDEIISFLERSLPAFDLIVAGDVLIYIGELESVFRLLPKCLSTEGRMVFSTELFKGKGYKLLPSGRYAHSTSYVKALAQENGLKILAVQSTKLRKENGRWIAGKIYIVGHAH